MRGDPSGGSCAGGCVDTCSRDDGEGCGSTAAGCPRAVPTTSFRRSGFSHEPSSAIGSLSTEDQTERSRSTTCECASSWRWFAAP